MNENWITIIGLLLLILPILYGLFKGLPGELEQMKYSVQSALQSLQMIVACLLSLWLLRTVVLHNTWQISQMQWVQQQLQQSLYAWFVAVPIGMALVYWFLNLFVQPLVALLIGLIHRLQGVSERLPNGVSRVLAAVLQVPRGMFRLLVFMLATHLVMPYLHVPAVNQMAASSPLYNWTDDQVINPILASSWVKQMPVLGDKANNWVSEISQEAAKNGPAGIRGYVTWQTRFNSDPQIDATAKQVVQGATTDQEKAYRLYQWIGSHVSYDDQKAAEIEAGQFGNLSFGAIPTFDSRTGVCTDYSSLMVAMGRAVGLQVKQEFGEAVLPNGGGGPHAWNEVYLSEQQKWVPCDPTWEQAGNFFDNPDFFVTHRPDSQAS